MFSFSPPAPQTMGKMRIQITFVPRYFGRKKVGSFGSYMDCCPQNGCNQYWYMAVVKLVVGSCFIIFLGVGFFLFKHQHIADESMIKIHLLGVFVEAWGAEIGKASWKSVVFCLPLPSCCCFLFEILHLWPLPRWGRVSIYEAAPTMIKWVSYLSHLSQPTYFCQEILVFLQEHHSSFLNFHHLTLSHHRQHHIHYWLAELPSNSGPYAQAKQKYLQDESLPVMGVIRPIIAQLLRGYNFI